MDRHTTLKNSLCSEVERQVDVTHVPEVVEDALHVVHPSAEGQVANEEGHLSGDPGVPPAVAAAVTLAAFVPPVPTPSPVAVTAHRGSNFFSVYDVLGV